MTAPNVSTLWGQVIVDELTKTGIEAVCLTPGSRCTPLTVPAADQPGIETFSLLDERSAAFFALGRARRTGRVTPVICTSGTAAANFHPAVVEADRGRVPLLLLTADRPPELHDSGANQTIDQDRLYGDAVRLARTLPDPATNARTLRALRTTVCRAVATAEGECGPVHLNVPFRKPLAPTVETDDVPPDFGDRHPLAVRGREGPFVSVADDGRTPRPALIRELADALASADRPLLVAGPADDLDAETAVGVAQAGGIPVLADPLSGIRFGSHLADRSVPICGGYDSYVEADLAPPDVVIRVGASPTSQPLRAYLAAADCRQVVVAPTGWHEAEFTATDLVRADPTPFLDAVAAEIVREPGGWHDRIAAIEREYWELVDVEDHWEGGVVADAIRLAPDPATVVISNSMPVRDLDRFGRPRTADLTVLGNRGASGIDGVTSTALGAGSATADPLVLITGDLAFYHDMNALAAIERCGVDATIVVVNNDGGGIFHRLPIADHETFEAYFRTPHGLDFDHTANLYGLEFARTDDRGDFRDLYGTAVKDDGTQVIEVEVDAAASHRVRERLHADVCAHLAD